MGFWDFFGAQIKSSGSKRHREDPSTNISHPWKVVRLAAKTKEQRRTEGGSLKSPQKKLSCHQLTLKKEGAIGTSRKQHWFPLWPAGGERTIVDHNYYRTGGHEGRFDAGTPDRAVSIATVAAYEKLQSALGNSIEAKVSYGDLGENILLDGPPAILDKDDGLYVGARLKIGTATIEITEANNPCYRFNSQPWAAAAQKQWGPTAPEGNPKQWFKSPSCPLQHIKNPGVRGWLARVVAEGDLQVGDTAQQQSTTTTTTVPPPAKRPRKNTDPTPRTKQTVKPKE